jgi:hypothetical protein
VQPEFRVAAERRRGPYATTGGVARRLRAAGLAARVPGPSSAAAAAGGGAGGRRRGLELAEAVLVEEILEVAVLRHLRQEERGVRERLTKQLQHRRCRVWWLTSGAMSSHEMVARPCLSQCLKAASMSAGAMRRPRSDSTACWNSSRCSRPLESRSYVMNSPRRASAALG